MVLHRVAGLFACHPEYCRLFHPLIGVDHINLDRRFVDIGGFRWHGLLDGTQGWKGEPGSGRREGL